MCVRERDSLRDECERGIVRVRSVNERELARWRERQSESRRMQVC